VSAEPPSARRLVIGIGNPWRGDDGVGAVVVERLETDPAPGVAYLSVYQLLPEQAETVHASAVVVFVDASAALAPGDVATVRVQPDARAAATAHHFSPGQVLALTRALHGEAPAAFLVQIGAATFDGQGLSPEAGAAVERAADAVRQLLLESAWPGPSGPGD
jgi:hydrogenase maturation protease